MENTQTTPITATTPTTPTTTAMNSLWTVTLAAQLTIATCNRGLENGQWIRHLTTPQILEALRSPSAPHGIGRSLSLSLSQFDILGRYEGEGKGNVLVHELYYHSRLEPTRWVRYSTTGDGSRAWVPAHVGGR